MEALGSRAGFAEQTQATIDAEVARRLRQAEHRAVAFLKEDRQVVDGLVDLLLTKRDPVDGSQVHALAGRSEPEVTASGMTLALDRGAAVAGNAVTGAPLNAWDGTDHR